MTSAADKYRRLVERLYERTRLEKMIWKYHDQDNYISTEVAGREITITEGANENFEPLYCVTITNTVGTVLESFNDENLNDEAPAIQEFRTYFNLLASLKEIATRQATGADKALDAILEELDFGDDEVPF